MPRQKTTRGEATPRVTVGDVPDPIFENARLARVYDPLDPDRSDLDVYIAIAAELGARSALDIGCGTGTFALMLAGRGLHIVGVDPAAASLDVARSKPGADRVRWVHGTAPDVLPLQVDAAFMTANVAQVFLTDEDWSATLRAAYAALRPGGHLVFETRDPRQRAWEGWTKERTHQIVDIPGEGLVEDWVEVTKIDGDLVTVESPTIFRRDGVRIESTSTLRFRSREQVTQSLVDAGFVVAEVRDAPDRPGRELVFIARRRGA